MTDDVHLAFAHPEMRAEVTPAGARVLDRISVRDLVMEVEIGAFQSERGTSQRIRFNIVVEVAPLPEAIDDDVDRILSYDRVTEAIAAELAAERINLLETLAARVAERILTEHQAMRVFVRIEKLDRGPGDLGVEIMRSRTSVPDGASETTESPSPRIVFLDNAAIADPALGQMIDLLVADPVPVILCVGPTGGPVPQSEAVLAQRRINLLAIEQNAWVLAGRDKRCIVTATRTELDWAMKHGQVSVWAPSKIVLDSVDPSVAGLGDGLGLAGWFAGLMVARELVVVGEAMAKGGAVPQRMATVGRPFG